MGGYRSPPRERCRAKGAPIPLIVSTMGWVKGLGVPLLFDIIRYAAPLMVADLRLMSAPGRNLVPISEGLGGRLQKYDCW